MTTENAIVREYISRLINAWNAGVREGEFKDTRLAREDIKNITNFLKMRGIAVYIEKYKARAGYHSLDGYIDAEYNAKFAMARITSDSLANPFE